jgi:Neprosin
LKKIFELLCTKLLQTAKDNLNGCYNTLCPGFVIANGSNLLPGQALSPLSTYGGEERYITLQIKKVCLIPYLVFKPQNM